jgi:hypothetical protein
MNEEQATYLCSLSAQELRIGNWVYDGERTQFPMQVVAIGKDWVHLDFPSNEGGVWETDIKDLRPIAVTVEILKKAGFKWDGGYGHKRLDENKTMQYYKHESRLRVWYKTEDVIFECHCVYYLHQLQNAYYMATGDELEVQP